MKHRILALLAALSVAAHAATPEQERVFVESYKKALENNDTAALAAFLHTEGATQETIDFFTTLQAMDAGRKIVSIQLVPLSPEERAIYNQGMSMPDGRSYKMPFTPVKQLILVVESASAEGTSQGTSKIAVGEKNGKLVIVVPVPAT